VRARVREHRPAQRQAQGKSKRENRYVIKVMSYEIKQGMGCGSLGSQEPKDAPSLFIFIGHWSIIKLDYNDILYLILSLFKNAYSK
jgi:hypothetical protein